MRDPLLLPAAGLIGGIALTRIVDFGLIEVGAAGLIFTVLAIVEKCRSAALSTVCALLAAVSAGVFAGEYHRPGAPPQLDTNLDQPVLIAGCVVEPPVFFEDRAQFTLELDRRAKARVSVYPREGTAPLDLRYGQFVELEARVRVPRNFHNPGSFDYAGYQARRDIYWTATGRTGAEVRILPGHCGSRLLAGLFALRSTVLQRIDRLFDDDDYSSSMMRAILLGDSSRLEKAWIEHFRRTGTYHALVISGLHVTVLAALLLFFLRICFVPPAAGLFVTSLAAWAYAIMAGCSAPVVRAAAGLTLYLVARLVYRRGRVLNLLAAVTIGFLIVDPGQLFEASFQLTFLAVGAIGALAVPMLESTAAPLARGLRGLSEPERDLHLEPRVAQFRVEMRLLAETFQLWTNVPLRWAAPSLAAVLRVLFYLYELFVVSAAVQLGLVLPMAAYFHRLSLSGLSANLIVTPLLSLTVPLGFVAALTQWHPLAWVTGLLLDWSRAVSQWHASWEPNWRIPDAPPWLAVAFAAALIVFAVSFVHPRLRLPAVTAAVFLLAVIVWHPFEMRVSPGILEMTAIDVGQGDSILIAFPDGRLAVVDAGGISTWGRRSPARLDIGEDVISPYLWSRSIRRLDLLVLTHSQDDHSGGLAALIDNYRPKELWIASADQALLDKARTREVNVRRPRAGERFEFGRASVTVLSPADEPVRTNDDSLVLLVRLGERSFLLTGDIEKRGEGALVAHAGELRADVLKVAHHGSRTSSTPAFVDRVRPSFAIISAGAGNPYRHPNEDVLARFQQRNTAVLRTDRHGLISIRTDGHRLWVDTQAWGHDQGRLHAPF